MPTHVEIKWKWIELHPKDTWSVIEDKLCRTGVILDQLSRSVYVIRAAGPFAIKHPKKYSPTLYIGEGRIKQRVTSHRKWLSSIYGLTGELVIEVAICVPRVRNNTQAHREFEA